MSKSQKNRQQNKFYVTTPIYYINGVAHIGHAYCTIAADVVARHYREKYGKENVLFTTGTDENSQKTVEAAAKAGQPIETYTKQTADNWQDIFNTLNISYNRFIRTTDGDHVKTVQEILQIVHDNGDIYKGTYEGLYCVGHEAFLKEEDLVDGLCPDHQKAPEHIKEENWFFRLSKYQEKLLDHIKSHPEFIQPETRKNEIISFIESNGLEDFSISRESQTWGIKLPFDTSQVSYVWFDALLNYVTAAGFGNKEKFSKWWPADLHIVGKDIIKFHCIYWPAMLWSAGLDLPKQIFAHGFFTSEATKISKSLGNAIDPLEFVERYGNDALRYFLLKEITFGTDGDFSAERFNIVYETELANKLGNLVSRVAAMLTKYNNSSYEITKIENSLELENFIETLAFEKYLSEIINRCEELNAAIEDLKPWERIKTNESEVISRLSAIATEIEYIGKLLKPILPDTSKIISSIFNNGKVQNSDKILFPKIP